MFIYECSMNFQTIAHRTLTARGMPFKSTMSQCGMEFLLCAESSRNDAEPMRNMSQRGGFPLAEPFRNDQTLNI